jgi:hypothetical protein
MNDGVFGPPGPTVGNLFGRRQDELARDLPLPAPVGERAVRAAGPLEATARLIGDTATQESTGWRVRGGVIERWAPVSHLPEGVEAIDYNNPYAQNIERVWFDGTIVYALDAGEVAVDPATTKVAQEYQIVYAVTLGEDGLPVQEPEVVPGQLNIYDSVPGMAKYSPIWQFNYVVVPRSYMPNTLRSEVDCLRSGHPVLRSNVFEN